MDIQYYKKINKHISLKLKLEDVDSVSWFFAPKQSDKISKFNDENDSFKIYDPIDKRSYTFPPETQFESETFVCPLPSIKEEVSDFVDVKENNEVFEFVVDKIKEHLSYLDNTQKNRDFFKSATFSQHKNEFTFIKTLNKIKLFGAKDINDFINNTESSMELCKANWRNKILEHAVIAKNTLLEEKNTADLKNDVETSAEISMIIQMIENVENEVKAEEYFKDVNDTNGLIKMWPPILLPVPSE